jgi:hypothetical protein
MPFFKRKRLLIIPQFQLSFLRYTVGLTLLVSGIYYGAIKFFFWRFRAVAEGMKIPSDHVFFRFLAEQEYTMGKIFLATSVIMAVVLIIHGLYFSNRIAGPIYHIQNHFKKLSDGSLPKGTEVKFRKGDYFHELAKEANELFGAHSKREKEIPKDKAG